MSAAVENADPSAAKSSSEEAPTSFVASQPTEYLTASTENTSSVGTSGQFNQDSGFDQAFQTPTGEYLEVNRLGNQWARVGTSERTSIGATDSAPSDPAPAMLNRVGNVPKKPKRARMWKFSISLKHPETGRSLVEVGRVHSGLERKPVDRYMWLIHDRDAGAAPHLQGAVRLRDSRTCEQVAVMLHLPAENIMPLVDQTGQHGAFERYCRYLLHESPAARAEGKSHYPDEVVHANFDFRDMIDRYFGYASSAPVMTVDQIALAVYRGEMSLADVELRYPMVYIRHLKRFETLYKKGQDERRRQAELLEQAALAEQAERREQLKQTRRLELADLRFSDDEISLAVEENLSEDDLFARRAEAERDAAERQEREAREAAELKEREARLQTERQSPEYVDRVRSAAEEQERQLIVTALAVLLDIRGDAAARDAGVRREAIIQGFVSKTDEPRDILSIDQARIFYCDAVDLEGGTLEESAVRVRQETEEFRTYLDRIPLEVSMAEYHTADGHPSAFEKALRLRTTYSGYPDLVLLPSPRSDLPKKQREQLLRADTHSAHEMN